MASGLAQRLAQKVLVHESTITHGGFYATEGTSAFDLARRIATAVAAARQAGAFPLVLAGNCMSALGTVSGMGGERRGVVWLDAHPDYNTADTSVSGFLDGMPVAVLAGDTYKTAAATVPGFRPIERKGLVFLGARDIDKAEAERIAADGIPLFSAVDYRARKAEVHALLDQIGSATDTLYLHFDMDVLDPEPVPANEYAAANGLWRGETGMLISAIAARTPLAAAGVTAFDPALDRGEQMLATYCTVIEQLAEAGAKVP
jgi:arginase